MAYHVSSQLNLEVRPRHLAGPCMASAPVTGGGATRFCLACNRPLGQGLALAFRGALVEVCELCYLLGTITDICSRLQDGGPVQEAIAELRAVYQLLRALEDSRSA